MRTAGSRGSGPIWLVAGSAVIIGCVLPILPEPAQLALALAVALLVVTFMTRSWLRLGASPRAISSGWDDEAAEVEASDHRLARWLTYLGLGTLAILTLRPTTTLTVSDWIFLGALVVAILGDVHESRGNHLAPPRLMLAGVALVLIGALLSLPNAVNGTESLAAVGRLVYLTVGWFAVAGYSLRTTRSVSVATYLWVASVALSGAAAVAQLGEGGSGRMMGLAQHVTDLGGMSAVALIPAVSFLDVRGHGLARRVASLALVAFVSAGLVLSGSVDGFVAAAFGLAIWIWAGGAGRRGVGVLLGLVALFVIVAGTAVQLGIILPEARIASVLSSPDDPNATFYVRLKTFDEAWRWIGANPVFGVGFDSASATTATGDVVHNVLIATWFEGGVFALLGIVLVLLAAARTAWRAWAGSRSLESQRLAAALLAAVGSGIMFSMANAILFQRYIWVPVFLAIALNSHRTPARGSASHKEATFGGGVGRTTSGFR